MFPYWALFSVFAAGSVFARSDPNRDKRLGSLIIAWLVITLMVGLRWEIGPDWSSYLRWWRYADNLPLDAFIRLARSDPVFFSIMWCFRAIGGSYWVLNLILAAVFATGLVLFSRAQVNPWLSIAVAIPWLVIVIGMSGVRQATAIAFVLLSIIALQRRQALRFLLWIALAACFHASAILFLPLAGLSFARTRLVAGVLIVATAVIGYYFLTPTFSVYSSRYFGRIDESAGTLYRIAMSVFPAVLYLLYRKYFPAEPHERSLWRNLAIVSILALPLYLVVPSSTALDRMLLYLFPLQMYVLSAIPSILGGRGGKTPVTALVLVYLGAQLFVFMNYGANSRAFVPYQTIFSR